MDEIASEEVKPLAHEEDIKEEEDSQPDPDEILNMEQGSGRVWSVKVMLQ